MDLIHGSDPWIRCMDQTYHICVPLPYHYRTITIPLPPPPVPPLPPFDQIFTIIFGSYVLIIGVLTCALVGVASRWCDIAADCRCGAKTITLPPPTPPRPFIRAQGGDCAAPPVRPRATRRPSCWTAPTPPPLGPFIRAQRGGGASILLPMGPLQVPVGRNILFKTCSNHFDQF